MPKMKIGTFTKEDNHKAMRRGQRDAELEMGRTPTHKVHKSQKDYNRKSKHKQSWMAEVY